MRCSCGDCAGLNAFLANPNLRKERFPMGKQRRQHLHNQLDAAGVDCTHVTEHVGSPHTLVVNKTTRLADAARREWRARQARADEVIKGFPAEALRALLGAEYDRIVSMEGIRLGAAASGSGAATRPAAPPREEGSGRNDGLAELLEGSPRGLMLKRKAVDVIDLTGSG